MDWENLNADVNKILNVHYSSGRFGRSIEHVVIRSSVTIPPREAGPRKPQAPRPRGVEGP